MGAFDAAPHVFSFLNGVGPDSPSEYWIVFQSLGAIALAILLPLHFALTLPVVALSKRLLGRHQKLAWTPLANARLLAGLARNRTEFSSSWSSSLLLVLSGLLMVCLALIAIAWAFIINPGGTSQLSLHYALATALGLIFAPAVLVNIHGCVVLGLSRVWPFAHRGASGQDLLTGSEGVSTLAFALALIIAIQLASGILFLMYLQYENLIVFVFLFPLGVAGLVFLAGFAWLFALGWTWMALARSTGQPEWLGWLAAIPLVGVIPQWAIAQGAPQRAPPSRDLTS